MKLKIFSAIDYLLLFCVVTLTTIGILFIYSAGVDSNGIQESREYIKQTIWFIAGFILMVSTSLIDYRKLSRYSQYMFLGMTFVLIYVRFFGKVSNGAKSWIGFGNLGIQPSELAKIIFILFLAKYLEGSQNENQTKRFITAFLIMCIPMGLILLQPDLGTASVFFPIFLFMCFMANIPTKYIMLVLSIGVLTIVFTILPVWETDILKKTVTFVHILTNFKIRVLVFAASLGIMIIGILGYIFYGRKYYYYIAYVFGILALALLLSYAGSKKLKDYQISRLIVFIDPYTDPRGTGWNIIQSKTAIGSGSLFGMGFLNGVQSHLHFLPEQNTDFIFSIFSEEAGFAGGVILFFLFFLILLRILYIVKQTTNVYSTYIAIGIFGMFLTHFIVNIGMVMGMMPITGIPLPFLSYGGSALLTNMIAIGLLMSINSRRLNFNVTL